MENKKTKKSNSEKPVRKKKSAKESSEEREPLDEREIEEMLEEEMLGELDEEDDDEFIHKVEEFKKGHSKSKMISVFKKIGQPKVIAVNKLDPDQIKDELKKLIVLLDKYNIIVHSHGDYDDKEKYRFITEEIFPEAIEDNKKKHVTFVYEDYHPEMEEDDDDDEAYDDVYDDNY
ncbi:MAG: hypothetical protein KDD00_05085 [Ignavibacteriae bacterium]|nr:hypothetical protein [Ignavibacteriota bacterium]